MFPLVSSGSSGSQTPVWERLTAKLRFAPCNGERPQRSFGRARSQTGVWEREAVSGCGRRKCRSSLLDAQLRQQPVEGFGDLRDAVGDQPFAGAQRLDGPTPLRDLLRRQGLVLRRELAAHLGRLA